MIPVNPAQLVQAKAISFPFAAGGKLANAFRRHLPRAAAQKFGCRHLIWSEGDKRDCVCLIQSGSVCFFRMLPDGRRAVIGFALPGDLIGLGAESHLFSAETMQPVRLEIMPVAILDRAAQEDAEFAYELREEVTRSLMAAYGHIASISKLSAAERLAHLLLELSERNRMKGLSAASIVLPMRRIEIADYLGLTIETVSRTFSLFRHEGLIDLGDPAIVTIKDIKRLAILARGDRDAEKGALCQFAA
jgi:CRP/FNR family transcriptional regulator, nitrogen fixation regulation protein